MKKILSIVIIAVLMLSTFSTLSSSVTVKGLIIEHHECWTKDVQDMLEYIEMCYDPDTQTFKWEFPKDTEKYQIFLDTSKEVNVIREQNRDKSIIDLVDIPLALYFIQECWNVLTMEYEHSENMFSVLETLQIAGTDEVTTIVTSLDQHVEATKIALGDHHFSSVTEIKSFAEANSFGYTVEAVDWSKVAIAKLQGVSPLQIAISLWEVADAVYNHKYIIQNKIEEALTEPDNIVQRIRAFELEVETGRLVVDISGTIGKAIGSIIGKSVGLAVGTAIGASFTGVFPPAPLVGGVVGYFAGSYFTGETFKAAARMLTNQFVKQPLLKFLDELDIQYEKISAEITSIYSEGSDYILSSREKIFVTVKNTGIYEREFIVSVNPSFWEITDYWGWFEWERVDWDNIKKETLKPFETKTIWFAAMPDGIHIDEDLTFNVWFEEGWLWWATQYRLDSHSATFHSIDLDVEAYITASSDPNIAMGETVDITVTVQNMKANPISFFLDAKLRDQSGDFERYDEQISISPSDQVHLEPNQKTTFTITWSVPSDALIGYYQLAVDCEKSPSSHIYLDNLLWKQIFFVYDLNILTPTSLHPANAGDPEDPNSIAVYATGIPLEGTPKFLISIDSGWIEPEITDRLLVPAGYALKVTPPTKADVGKYDLDTVALFAERGGAYTEHDTDSEPNAVEYTSAPSVEPIERGLAWLRTRQYGDGSWRSNVGVAALSVLAFLNAGLDETDSDVDEAIQYLLSKARGDGSIYSSYPTYETSLALMALVATHNSDHQATIDAARDWLANSQWDENCIWGSVGKDSWYYGGFGYGWHTRPDLSNSQFALLALDAAGLPKDDPLWTKAQVFLHRCQNIEFPITLNIEGSEYTVQPFNHFGGYDGGFIYYPGASLAGGQKSYGSMTGAGIWGLLLSGVAKSDQRLAEAMNWVADNYSWDTNPGIGWWRPYYYYLSMSKALTMYGQKIIDGHDWYQELCDKLEGSQTNIGPELGYWSTSAEDYNPDLTTAYAILSLQTRAAAPPIQRLSYLTFVLRSNSLIRILDPEGNLVGYNYMTGMGENNIPTAVYSGPFYEPQYVVIVNPEAGTYDLELIGISEGQYELTIQGNYGEEVTDVFEYTGEIAPAELHGTDVTVTAIVGPVDVYTEPPEFEEIIDNTPPSITVLTPREDPPEALQDGVTLEANVTDPSGVDWVTFSIRETDGSVIDAMFESMSANYIGDDVWQIPSFNTYVPELPDGYYLLLVNASDTLGNEGDKTVLFSIRNWACLELLPSTQANKAGRTMPVKFSLRVFENVDPAKPFVYNEELTIVIYEEGDPDNILQTSTYGETARDYRIDSIGELYITNFKTIRKKLTTYVVEICRKDLLIGWFTFKTVK